MGRPKKYTPRFIRREAVALLRFARSQALPLKAAFAATRRYSSGYISDWAKADKLFAEAVKRFEDIQQQKFVHAAIRARGNNVAMTIFTLKNVCGWQESPPPLPSDRSQRVGITIVNKGTEAPQVTVAKDGEPASNGHPSGGGNGHATVTAQDGRILPERIEL